MGLLITPDYSQVYVFPPQIEFWIPEDHPARYVRDFVAVLKSRKPELFDSPVSLVGRPQYADSMLFGIWIYAYISGLRSVREVEKACGDVLPVIWLAGTHRPDHNTLWRFWSRNKKVIRKSSIELIKIALEKQMIGFVLQAIDGTKIRAASSSSRALTQEEMRSLIERLDKRIGELEAEIASCGSGSEEATAASAKKIDAQTMKKKFEEVVDSWGEAARSVDEHEAVMMKGHGLAYNGQIVVDEKCGMIVANNVVTDTNDQNQLIPMLDQLKQEQERVAELTLGDGGYNTAEALAGAAGREFQVLVNRSSAEAAAEKKPYHAVNFSYDEQTDTVRCPENKLLTFDRATKRKKQPYAVRIYRGRECGDCPMKPACTSDKRGRTIEISPHEKHVQAQREKRRNIENQKQLQKRMHLAETPFATIKERLGFRRFSMRGLEKVRAQFDFIALVHNIKILIREHNKELKALLVPLGRAHLLS